MQSIHPKYLSNFSPGFLVQLSHESMLVYLGIGDKVGIESGYHGSWVHFTLLH